MAERVTRLERQLIVAPDTSSSRVTRLERQLIVQGSSSTRVTMIERNLIVGSTPRPASSDGEGMR